jgi:hypothetical protein
MKNTFRCQVAGADTLVVTTSAHPSATTRIQLERIAYGDLDLVLDVHLTEKQAIRLGALLNHMNGKCK